MVWPFEYVALTRPPVPTEMALSFPKAMPSDVIPVTLTFAGVSPEASCVNPSVPPMVPRLREIVLSAAPLLQPVIEIVGGLGFVLASEPSGLKVTSTDPLVVPVGVDVSVADVGLANVAVQLFAAFFVQVTWMVLSVPRPS